MDLTYLLIAIPLFIIFVGLEAYLSHKKQDNKYRFNDTISNLSNGLGQQAVGLFTKVIQLFFYTWFYKNFRIFSFKIDTIYHWILALLIADFCYYIFHRASHRINILVGSHVVHHQSEEYNLSVALRQSWLTRFYSWLFYLPLAFIGVPTEMFVGVMAVVIIYQFWIHTQYIKKLGFLERILVTPSHHRVHHGKNPEYIDKNYGAIFIIWDKFFNTFQEEKDAVVYGTIKPANTWNPLWANFRYYKILWRRAKNQSQILNKIKIWILSPDWNSIKHIPHHSKTINHSKYDKKADPIYNYIIVAQFFFTFLFFGFILNVKNELNLQKIIMLSVAVLWSLTNIGGLQESKAWVRLSQLLFLFYFCTVMFIII